MPMLNVVGKGGIFLLVRQGRLIKGAEAVATFKEIFDHAEPDGEIHLDAGAVELIKTKVLGQ